MAAGLFRQLRQGAIVVEASHRGEVARIETLGVLAGDQRLDELLRKQAREGLTRAERSLDPAPPPPDDEVSAQPDDPFEGLDDGGTGTDAFGDPLPF